MTGYGIYIQQGPVLIRSQNTTATITFEIVTYVSFDHKN